MHKARMFFHRQRRVLGSPRAPLDGAEPTGRAAAAGPANGPGSGCGPRAGRLQRSGTLSFHRVV